MPLESCMLVLDNSEYMRNGDYTPTRFQAQAQAVSAVFSAKTDANPESAVGLMTMAGKSGDIGPEALLLTAQPVSARHADKRHWQASFGSEQGGDRRRGAREAGQEAAEEQRADRHCHVRGRGYGERREAAGGGESHLVSVPAGPHLLSDVIQQSPILYDGEREVGGGGGGDDDFDASMDPELAMALRMSLQEAQEREARERGGATTSNDAVEAAVVPQDVRGAPNPEQGHTAGFTAGTTGGLTNANDPSAKAPGDSPAGDEDMLDDEDEDDEEAMLARAMALSRGENPDDVDMDDDEDEEAAIARAIAMSLEDQGNKDEKK
ncbi:RPN10-like protein [Trichosporon asahii var. asahii CBS 2479]|uniref:RPN10-like protein n=1 Tax=Trichosporon asahii var. asahii (strain ATCC 90039 / CBS 2479 / JCM 2466 / KCTC 7840 / NBRC 103889/ NCYC 2677 / UAMH 7654) TaxID=1186058 RepID=J6EYL3_TRIAS|nr:RPN10-like protein [Trichosporon asahii var. asahii CBS 2479]EJT47937.1 RPN10-like protein [Trichosporon asahii var. asahii CBS 2479]